MKLMIAELLAVAPGRGVSRVSFLGFKTGGHNYRNYRRYLPEALQWLDHVHVAAMTDCDTRVGSPA
jgi:hypothetical protein